MADILTDTRPYVPLVGTTRTEPEVIVDLLSQFDNTSPVVTLNTAPGTIAPNATLEFEVDDETGTVARVLIKIAYADRTEVAFDASGWPLMSPVITTPYSVTVTDNGSGGWLFEVTHSTGWPANFDATCVTIDNGGNVGSDLGSFTVSPAPAGVSITVDTPAGIIAPTAQIDVTATDGDNEVVLAVYLFAEYAGRVELIYDGAAAQPGYAVVVTPGVGDALYEVTHDAPGFPNDFTLDARVVGDGGGTAADTAVFDVDPEQPGADATPPVVSNVSPTPGTPIEASQTLSFDVTDNSGTFRRILLGVAFQAGEIAGITELVHDGDSFLGHYVGTSSRAPISGGFRYTLLRSGGWPASPTLRVFGFDQSGNEV